MDRISTEDQLIDWVNEYTDYMVGWAVFKTNDRNIAEDLVQETFLSAFNNLSKFKQTSSPKTWLLTILKNKIIDHHRKQIRSNEVPQSKLSDGQGNDFFDDHGGWISRFGPHTWNQDSNELLDDEEFQQILKSCMKELPSQWMSAIQYKYLDEKNTAEVCQELNVSTSNYWQLLHRAKMRLRSCLNSNWYQKDI